MVTVNKKYENVVLGVVRDPVYPTYFYVQFDIDKLKNLAKLADIEIGMMMVVNRSDKEFDAFQPITNNSVCFNPGAPGQYAGLDSPGAILSSQYFNDNPLYPNSLGMNSIGGIPNYLMIQFRNKRYFSDAGEEYSYIVMDVE